MPVYDYLCETCGPFTDMRPMAECDDPQACPDCTALAPRAILNVPYFACMPAERRTVHAVNERSCHAPQTVDRYKARHGASCACCKPKKPARLLAQTKSGAKSFPTARPWMISH